MEVRQLEIFRVLAEELNFTRTAERVHTVQSNVTAQIKALEGELGVPLFDRLGRRVTITDAGRRFLPFAEQALAAMEHGKQAVHSGSEPSGPLLIGAPESVLTYRLPPVVGAFRRRFPHVELMFRPYADETLAQMIESGKLDMAIYMSDQVLDSPIESFALRLERVFLLSANDHPLARLSSVKPADLAGHELLLTESGCGYRCKLDRLMALDSVRPGHITEFSSVEAIKQCVRAGMGLALLPAIVVARELQQRQIKALHWAGPTLDIAMQLVWHKDKWISPAMAAFQKLIRESLKDSGDSGIAEWDGVLAGASAR